MELVWPFEGIVPVAVNLLVGGAALYAASQVCYRDDELDALDLGPEHALVTALGGAVTWTVLAGVPLVGGPLALAGWIGVLGLRYPGGWGLSAAVGAGAWVVAVVVLAALELLGVGAFSALGLPGV